MSNERDTSPVITQDKLLEYHNNLVYPFLNGVSTKGDQAFVPCGKIEAFMTSTAPKGYLVCDGTEYLKSAYPSLAAVLGAVDTAQSTSYFAGSDANHFKVPDLRGEFLRGKGTNGHSGQGSGGNVGQHQDSTTISRSLFDFSNNVMETYGSKSLINYDSDTKATDGKGLHFNGSGLTGDWIKSQTSTYTSRPTNTSVLYCIAYEDLYLTPRHTYSTDEQVVGTWIDGKPLYEKTVEFTWSKHPSTQWTALGLGVLNVDYAESKNDFVLSITGSKISIPISGTIENTSMLEGSGARLVIPTSGAELILQVENIGTTSALYNYDGYIYCKVRYTKTTDTVS